MKSDHHGSSFDDFLREEGTLAKVYEPARERVERWLQEHTQPEVDSNTPLSEQAKDDYSDDSSDRVVERATCRRTRSTIGADYERA